tara:strand:+ start:1357 stop:1560 length:204 start_codon:yes stop_codon:yes gene_type:complete
MKDSIMMYGKKTWADIIDEEYDDIEKISTSIINNIYYIIDQKKCNTDILWDINNIKKSSEQEEWLNM